jgi:hypothetical protein
MKVLCVEHHRLSFRASQRRVEKSVFNRFLHFASLRDASVEMTYGLSYRAIRKMKRKSILPDFEPDKQTCKNCIAIAERVRESALALLH